MAIDKDNVIESVIGPESFPPNTPGQSNIYKPSTIKRYGVSNFLGQVSPKGPVQPDFAFTDEEQRRMDEILGERESA